MILAFADLHLGIKTYSTYDSKGLSTAEYEARKVLEEIYQRASKDDIDRIIFCGDFFHSNQPSSENIKHVIEWFHKMDLLNKPFQLIPGNHDAAIYSNSIIFLESLKLKNTQLFTLTMLDTWNDWYIGFIPYHYNDIMKNKEEEFHSEVEQAILEARKKTIIVSHVQEVTAKIGSESLMISKGVDIIDIDNIHQTKDIILLSGHMHKHQIYKKGFMTVCYPGNCYYHDLSDCNQPKGYVLLDNDGNIKFEEMQSIRKFISIYIPISGDIDILLTSRRMKEDSVIFLSVEQERDVILEDRYRRIIYSKNCMLGGIKWGQLEDSNSIELASVANSDPYVLLENKIQSRTDLDTNMKSKVLKKGFSYIDRIKGDNTCS